MSSFTINDLMYFLVILKCIFPGIFHNHKERFKTAKREGFFFKSLPLFQEINVRFNNKNVYM